MTVYMHNNNIYLPVALVKVTVIPFCSLVVVVVVLGCDVVDTVGCNTVIIMIRILG